MNELIVASKLMNYKRVIIAGHLNPDGDSIGACLGLGLALEQYGTEVIVLLGELPSKYDFICGKELIKSTVDDDYVFDAFIALDCASKDRLENHACVLFDRAPVTISIDHHKTNTNFAEINIVKPNSSSTCETLFDVLVTNFVLSPNIATALLTGILYDTGGLCHETTSVDTFNTVSKLIKCDIPYSKIYSELINIHTFAESKLLARAINNIEFLNSGKVAISSLSTDEITAEGATIYLIDSIVGYLKNIKGVELSIFIYETGLDTVKISLRSENDIDVSAIAAQLSGGGHKYAAGAPFNGTIVQAKEKVIELLQDIF